MKDLEKNVSDITPEDLAFIREYIQLPEDKKILVKEIVMRVNLDEKNGFVSFGKEI